MFVIAAGEIKMPPRKWDRVENFVLMTVIVAVIAYAVWTIVAG
jgi:hypothetical protein